MISHSQTVFWHEQKIVLYYGWTTLHAHKVSEFSEFPGCLTSLVSRSAIIKYFLRTMKSIPHKFSVFYETAINTIMNDSFASDESYSER